MVSLLQRYIVAHYLLELLHPVLDPGEGIDICHIINQECRCVQQEGTK